MPLQFNTSASYWSSGARKRKSVSINPARPPAAARHPAPSSAASRTANQNPRGGAIRMDHTMPHGLDVTDVDHLVFALTARRLNLHYVAGKFANQGAGQRRRERNLALLDIGLVFTDDLI